MLKINYEQTSLSSECLKSEASNWLYFFSGRRAEMCLVSSQVINQSACQLWHDNNYFPKLPTF